MPLLITFCKVFSNILQRKPKKIVGFLPSVQESRYTGQYRTFQFIKSYVLNNRKYLFFPHRKAKKEWNVLVFYFRMLVAHFLFIVLCV